MTLLYILLVLIVIGLVFLFWYFNETKKNLEKNLDGFSQKVDNLFLPQINSIREELSSRLKESKDTLEKTTQMFVSNIHQFSSGIAKIDEVLKQLKNSMDEINTVQEIFRTPKLRGRWGEITLEKLLAQVLAPTQFQMQYSFKSGEMVDAVIKLPDKRIIPIDAKFPYDFFEKMVEEEDKDQKEIYKKNFLSAVKKEIDDIAKKYILPSEGTFDFALMYVPAEAVYYEISNQLREENLNEYARKKKVLLVSPNMLFAFLRVIAIANRDYQISQQIHKISKKLERILIDANKLSETFVKLGKHLSDSRSAYEESQKRLNFFLERAQNLVDNELQEAPKLVNKEKGEEDEINS